MMTSLSPNAPGDVPGAVFSVVWESDLDGSGSIVVTFGGQATWVLARDDRTWDGVLDRILAWKKSSFAEDATLSRERPYGAPFELGGDGAEALLVSRHGAHFLVRAGDLWAVCHIVDLVRSVAAVADEVRRRLATRDMHG